MVIVQNYKSVIFLLRWFSSVRVFDSSPVFGWPRKKKHRAHHSLFDDGDFLFILPRTNAFRYERWTTTKAIAAPQLPTVSVSGETNVGIENVAFGFLMRLRKFSLYLLGFFFSRLASP